jgi:hypothetical protein
MPSSRATAVAIGSIAQISHAVRSGVVNRTAPPSSSMTTVSD